MKTRNVHQTVSFKAPVHTVYRALMDSKQHSKFTGAKASIGAKPGSRFSVWGGSISGITLHIVPDKMIVQAWRTDGWPEGHYSVAMFTFQEAGKGTKLVFDQLGVPAGDYADISTGWKDYYWDPMKKFLDPRQ